jgi:hypothetical protein
MAKKRMSKVTRKEFFGVHPPGNYGCSELKAPKTVVV